MADVNTEPPQVDGESYNPYEHRHIKRGISDFGAFATFVKCATGSGLFAMPFTYRYVGMALGISLTIVMGILITVSLQLLLAAHHEACIKARQPMLRYDEVVAQTFSRGRMRYVVSPRIAALVVDFVILSSYVGISAVYIMFIAGAVQEVIDAEKYIAQGYYVLILFPLLLALNMVEHIRSFVPFCVVSDAMVMIAAIIGFVYALKDGVRGNFVMIEPNTKHYTIFLGTVFFSMCPPALLLTIEHSMERPWNFSKRSGILNIAMLLLVISHAAIGTAGYYRWGNKTTQNLIRNHPVVDGPTLTALIMQILSLYLTYGLHCYMPISILHHEYAEQSIKDRYIKGTSHFWNLVIRFLVTVVTCLLAVSVPRLDLFISFIGAVGVSTLGSLLPVSLYVVTHWGSYGICYWKLIPMILSLSAGLIAMFSTTITTVAAIAWYVTG